MYVSKKTLCWNEDLNSFINTTVWSKYSMSITTSEGYYSHTISIGSSHFHISVSCSLNFAGAFFSFNDLIYNKALFSVVVKLVIIKLD